MVVVVNRHLPFPHPPPPLALRPKPKHTFVCLSQSSRESSAVMIPKTTVTRKLQVVTPVPSDIDIANSVEPQHISEIAKSLNLSPLHYDLYGKYKAKVLPLLSIPFFPLCFSPDITQPVLR